MRSNALKINEKDSVAIATQFVALVKSVWFLGIKKKGEKILLEASWLDITKTPTVPPLVNNAFDIWIPFP